MSLIAQNYDLLISHNQIQVRSRGFDEALCQWGKVNIEQGAIIHDDYVVFDPLPDDAFGAQVHVIFASEFVMDDNTQRCIAVPFKVNEKESLVIASATEKFDVELNYSPGDYELYYEVCEGDEIYYRFTFIPSASIKESVYMMDDPWGGIKNNKLETGIL